MFSFGVNNGIKVGQLVIDLCGVMGQVVYVLFSILIVMLIIDLVYVLLVMIECIGLCMIVYGVCGGCGLILFDIFMVVDVWIGDWLLILGLGGCFFFGFLVGMVICVQFLVIGMFLEVSVMFVVDIDCSEDVLLLYDQVELIGLLVFVVLVGLFVGFVFLLSVLLLLIVCVVGVLL